MSVPLRLAALSASIAAACSSAPRTVTPPAPVVPDPSPAIDALGDRAVRDGTVGVSIVVMRGDRVVHARGYGFEDVEQERVMTPQSIVPLASITKQIWAVALMQLVHAGKLELSARVSTILPRFPAPTTVITLLEHMSGLGDDVATEDDDGFTDLHFDFPPGTWWQYSNRGSLIVRRIVEAVSKLPWPQYLQERIAKPAGLPSLATCGAHVPLYTKDHQPAGLPDSEMARIEFVCANALDLARFETTLDAGTLLDATSLGEMRTNASLGMSSSSVRLPYGLFTRIAEVGGHRAYGHTGNLPGASVAAFRFPADDVTIVVLENTDPPAGDHAYELVARIARQLLNVSEPRPLEMPPAAEELTAIAGTYDAPGIGRARISARDGRAWLEILDDHGEPSWGGPLAWLGGRTFSGGPTPIDLDRTMTFVPATGPAQGVMLGHTFVLDVIARRVPAS